MINFGPENFQFVTSQACLTDLSPPTFSGISGLTANPNGSLTASWSAATDSTTPVRYRVYIQANTATGLFSISPVRIVEVGTSAVIFTDASGASLVSGVTYFVGVRAVDAVGNSETNTVSISAVSLGVPDNSLSNKLDTLLGRLTSGRATNLDFLDVAVSSRATQASVDNIQNNTMFSASVPSPLVLPTSGSTVYKLHARLFNDSGAPVDPDSNDMTITIRDSAGGVVVATTSMTRTGVGQYEYPYTVLSSDPERQLTVFFDYLRSAVVYSQVRPTIVQEFESKLDTLLGRLTAPRATNLDNLNAPVATVQTTVSDVQSKIGVPITTVTGDIAAIQTKLGSPAGASVSADIASTKAVVDVVNTNTAGLRTDYSTIRAARLDNLDDTVTSRQSAATAATQFGILNTNDAGILAAVNSIQNNTNFVGIVPNPLERPSTGSSTYAIYANLFDSVGSPNDPDLNIMNYRIEDTLGALVVPTTAMTRLAVGQYKVNYTVLSTDPLRDLVVFFEYEEGGTAFQQIRTSKVGGAEGKLDIIINRIGIPADTVSDDIASIKEDTVDIRIKTTNINDELIAAANNTDLVGEIEDETEVG